MPAKGLFPTSGCPGIRSATVGKAPPLFPDTPIEKFMVQHVFKVRLDSSPQEVADLMDKYDLLAVPVIDETEHLKGIITHDDILELLKGSYFSKKRSKII